MNAREAGGRSEGRRTEGGRMDAYLNTSLRRQS